MNKDFIKTLFICTLLLILFFLAGCGHGRQNTVPFLNFNSPLHEDVSDGSFRMAPGIMAEDLKEVF